MVWAMSINIVKITTERAQKLEEIYGVKKRKSAMTPMK